jgi:hypothetical protein
MPRAQYGSVAYRTMAPGGGWNTVNAATTANIALSGLLTVDGVVLGLNWRVLVKNQTTPSQNGIYLAQTGAWTRPIDADASGEIYAGLKVSVTMGLVNGGTVWGCTATGATPWVPGTSTSTWAVVTEALPPAPVIVASTANIAALSGLLTIDSALLSAGHRVLVKDQTNAIQNGIYIAQSGAWQRAQDGNTTGDIYPGFTIGVGGGIVNYNTAWACSATGASPWIPNTSTSAWAQSSEPYIGPSLVNGPVYNSFEVPGKGGLVIGSASSVDPSVYLASVAGNIALVPANQLALATTVSPTGVHIPVAPTLPVHAATKQYVDRAAVMVYRVPIFNITPLSQYLHVPMDTVAFSTGTDISFSGGNLVFNAAGVYLVGGISIVAGLTANVIALYGLEVFRSGSPVMFHLGGGQLPSTAVSQMSYTGSFPIQVVAGDYVRTKVYNTAAGGNVQGQYAFMWATRVS